MLASFATMISVSANDARVAIRMERMQSPK